MPPTNDTTTLVCLFHNDSHAQAALEALYHAGVDRSSITSFFKKDSDSIPTTLETLGVPERDREHLQNGVADGGTLITVAAAANAVDTVERIFGEHQATKVDEAVRETTEPLATSLPTAQATAIPIVEEELQVGKRAVDRGGVRVYRRVIEMPAEETINLREEHVTVDRKAVDRPATQADLDGQGNRSIELTETAEEAVVSKSAHVVEEIVVGKVSAEHTEQIRDTVRHTEVEVAELDAVDPNKSQKTL